MNILILSLAHFIWICLAIGVFAYGLRDMAKDLRDHFSAPDKKPYQAPKPLFAENKQERLPARTFSYS